MDQDIIDLDPHQGWALEQHAPPGPGEQSRNLLFLHGMAGGSWVWTPDWIDRFTAQGYRCWTMTLPGRRSGPGMASDPVVFERSIARAFEAGDIDAAIAALGKALPGASVFDGPGLGDYTNALQEALEATQGPTCVVAHSLGGAVLQSLLRRGRRPAGSVLLCSVPPYGLWRASMQTAVTNLPLWKALFDFSIFGRSATDPEVLRRNLFPAGIDDRSFAALLTRFTDESLKATSQAQGLTPFAPLPGPRSDMLVLGGARDRLLPPLDVHLTGLYYGSPARMIDGAGHMPMYEPRYRDQTAQCILDWLDEQG